MRSFRVCDEHFRNLLKYSFLNPEGDENSRNIDGHTSLFSCLNVGIQKMKRVKVKNLPNSRRIHSLATSAYLSFLGT